MKLLVISTSFSVIIFSSVCVSAQDDGATEPRERAARLPYEVVVTPTITRVNLRRLIVDVEDDFFEKFNELNLDDDYDVACYKEKITMSHISTRVCEPWFMIKARGAASADLGYKLGTSLRYGSQDAPMIYTVNEMRQKMSREYESLQEKMEQFTRSDLEFRSIGNALAELKSRLENFGKD